MTSSTHATYSLKGVLTKTSLLTNRRLSLSSLTWAKEKLNDGRRIISKRQSDKLMDLIPGQLRPYSLQPSRLPFSMKTRKKNPSESSITSVKETGQLKNMSTNSNLQSAKQDYPLTTTWLLEPSEKVSTKPLLPESYTLTRNRTLLKTQLSRKDGTLSLLNLTEFIETMSKLSMNDQTNQWDDNRLLPTDSTKFMGEDINQDQHINEGTTKGTINPDMIRMPWMLMSSLWLSMRWVTKNEASTWRKDSASTANNLDTSLMTVPSQRTTWTHLSWLSQAKEHWIFQQPYLQSMKRQLHLCSTIQQSDVYSEEQQFIPKHEHNQETRATRNQQDDLRPHHWRMRWDVCDSRSRWRRERTKWEGFFLRRAESTTVSPTLNVYCTCSTIPGQIDNKLLNVPVTIMQNKRTSETSTVDTQALIDSGAEGEFIDQNYARTLGIKQTALKELIKVLNVDGTWNKWGIITHYMELDLLIENRIRWQWLYITGLGKQKIILGFTWLKEMNPDIN